MPAALLYTHHDHDVRRVLSLRLFVDVDHGQPRTSSLDPGDCEPEIPPHVEDLDVQVLEVLLIDVDDQVRHRLSRRDGSLSGPAAEALSREFLARYYREDDLQREVDSFCVNHVLAC